MRDDCNTGNPCQVRLILDFSAPYDSDGTGASNVVRINFSLQLKFFVFLIFFAYAVTVVCSYSFLRMELNLHLFTVV